ncbi:MAG: MBL fold metallo-hydrolase [Candidatus Syntropharchaeia archaeon]
MNLIKFLGTAGARFAVIKQLRASGGTWLILGGKNILIDPGPGTLVRCLRSRPKLDPSKLDGIILTHKHLDHSSDINIMIEAMTDGGYTRRGVLFCPEDALSEDPVVLKYLREFPEEIKILRERGEYSIGEIRFNTPKRHVHGVETYGLNVRTENFTISFIVDTKYFPGLEEYYDGDILVLNVLRYTDDKREIDHLSVPDAERIISLRKPKVAILTHFGMTMIRNKPHEIAARMEKKVGTRVIAASDGMSFDIDKELGLWEK